MNISLNTRTELRSAMLVLCNITQSVFSPLKLPKKDPVKIQSSLIGTARAVISSAGLSALVFCGANPTVANADTGVGNTPGGYVGVGSCASSQCHGSVAPREGNNVLQNEYTTWLKHDTHSKAWKVLLNDDSKLIAKHLGIAAPEKDPQCLQCHSTYVPNKAQQGSTYQIEDGVGCESCHGPGEKWLGSHTAHDASHKNNLELGMTDLATPEKQASMCLSCHFGSDDKFVNHRLIGAGHPRLCFELDTFASIAPRHWLVDDDYRLRKDDYNAVQGWFEGQIAQADSSLARLASEKRSRDGVFPEFSIFSCSECHHSLTEGQWKKREYNGQPGIPKLNLSSLVMVREALAVVNPALMKKLADQLDVLHTSYVVGGNAPAGAISLLRKFLKENKGTILREPPPTTTTKALIARLTNFAATQKILSYEDAEQVAMGISTFANQIQPDGSLYKTELEKLYGTLKDPKAFVAEDFNVAANNFVKKIK